MTELNIVPECEVDTRIVQILADISKRPNHQKGHGNVASKMQFDLKNYQALGIIDEDTIKVRKAKYFSEFKSIKTENGLTLKKHEERNHYLIVIMPAIEKWLLQNAELVNIIPENLGYELSDLKNFTKKKSIHKNQDFYVFIKKLIRQQAPGIILLKTWLEKFIANEELK